MYVVLIIPNWSPCDVVVYGVFSRYDKASDCKMILEKRDYSRESGNLDFIIKEIKVGSNSWLKRAIQFVTDINWDYDSLPEVHRINFDKLQSDEL